MAAAVVVARVLHVGEIGCEVHADRATKRSTVGSLSADPAYIPSTNGHARGRDPSTAHDRAS